MTNLTINRKTRVHGIFAGDVSVAKTLSIGKEVVLVREKNNQYDANAVKVCVEVKGMLWGKKLVKIGYLQKEVAKNAAKLLDSGINLLAVVEYFKDYDKEPSIEVRVTNL